MWYRLFLLIWLIHEIALANMIIQSNSLMSNFELYKKTFKNSIWIYQKYLKITQNYTWHFWNIVSRIIVSPKKSNLHIF